MRVFVLSDCKAQGRHGMTQELTQNCLFTVHRGEPGVYTVCTCVQWGVQDRPIRAFCSYISRLLSPKVQCCCLPLFLLDVPPLALLPQDFHPPTLPPSLVCFSPSLLTFPPLPSPLLTLPIPPLHPFSHFPTFAPSPPFASQVSSPCPSAQS